MRESQGRNPIGKALVIQMIQICPNWKFYSMHTTLAEASARISILSWKKPSNKAKLGFYL